MKRLKNLFKGDPIVWWCFLVLTIVSAVFVFSSIGLVSKGNPVHAWLKHMAFVALSWVFAIVISHFNYRKFARWSKPLLLVSIGLLVLVLVVGGRRWLSVGPFQFQPSEVAKIALLVSIAKLLATNTDKLQDLGFFLRLMGLVAVVAGLIVTENFSTAALVSLICLLMMFFGGVNLVYWRRTLIGAALAAGVFLAISYNRFERSLEASGQQARTELSIERSETWAHRVYTWVKNDTEEYNQVNLARMAIARGGLPGKGFGNTVIGRINPQMHSDFIYAFIIEEGGLVWGLLIFVVYASLCSRCVKMAKRCRGTFGSLLLGGLGTYIFVQALVHMAYNVRVIPVTGQTLPLVSHGGTSYVMFGVALGIIQSVCNDVRKKERAEREEARRQRGFEETYEIAKTKN